MQPGTNKGVKFKDVMLTQEPVCFKSVFQGKKRRWEEPVCSDHEFEGDRNPGEVLTMASKKLTAELSSRARSDMSQGVRIKASDLSGCDVTAGQHYCLHKYVLWNRQTQKATS